MAKPNMLTSVSDMLGIEEGELDYGSDTESKQGTPVYDDTSKQAPNPFPERGAVNTETALPTTPGKEPGSPLDAEQGQGLQQWESAQRRSQTLTTIESHCEYVFTPLSVEERLRHIAGQSLISWRISPETTTPDAIEARRALRERYLVPIILTHGSYKMRLDKQAQGILVSQMRGVPVLFVVGEFHEGDDNAFIRWVHKARRLSSMMALRASADKEGVFLERKLRYEFAKWKGRGRAALRSRYTPAVPVDASPHQTSVVDRPATIFGAKRLGSQADPDHGAQKLPRLMGNPDVGVPRTPTSSQTYCIPATSPDTCIGHDGDAVEVSSQHETGSSLARPAAPVAFGVSIAAHEALVHELNRLRETLSRTHKTLVELQARLSTFATGQTRMKVQLDLLIRMQQPVARATFAAQAPPDQHGMDLDTA